MSPALEIVWREYADGRRNSFRWNLSLLGLVPLSYVYGVGVQAYRWMYDLGILRQVGFSVPVISVGNITVGGTGKTPFVREVAQHLLERGHRPVILSRGYRNEGSGSLVATAENWREAGDEASMLAWLLPETPVIVDPHRDRAGRLAMEKFGASHLILDDGCQYWRVRKDAEILLLNAERPFGNGRVFPAGTLREFPGNACRATAIVATGDLPASDAIPAAHFRARHRPDCLLAPDGCRVSLDAARGREYETLSGIGDSGGFTRTLRSAGLEHPRRETVLPDHTVYSEGLLREQMPSLWESDGCTVITTAKDLVKLRSFRLPASGRLFALLTRFQAEGATLDEVLGGRQC